MSIEFTYSESDSKARYGATVDGSGPEAELTTSKVSDTLIIVDHTFVPDALRGKGIAAALGDKVIADARQAGKRIVPLCPFLRSYTSKNKEAYADVIQW